MRVGDRGALKNFVLDLVAASKDLPSAQFKLAKLIIQLRDSHSIRTDLTLAHDFVGTMELIREQAAEAEAGNHTENSFLALLLSALLLYVRATKTTSRYRASFDFRKEYDAEENVKHTMLCRLRDEAVAHFGPGGVVNSPAFQEDAVFLAHLPDGSGQVFSASRRSVITPQLITDLCQMVHRALILADKRTQTLNEKVVEKLNEELAQNPSLAKVFQEHAIDLAGWVGGDEWYGEVLETCCP